MTEREWRKACANFVLNEVPRWVDFDRLDAAKVAGYLRARLDGAPGKRVQELLKIEFEKARRA